MSSYSFRIKLPKAVSASIEIDEPRREWELGAELSSLVLSSGSDGVPISKAEVLYFTSDGWPDEESARAASERYVGALARTLARLRVGVDYGDRAPGGGGFTGWLIQQFWEEHGARVINEKPGVMIYESDPPPLFASGSGALQLAVQAEQFERVFAAALEDAHPLSERERVSLALYNAAFFEESQDARFLLHMIALEALLRPAERPAHVLNHLDHIAGVTQAADTLTQPERDSLCGALAGLRRESVGQAGRALVGSRLHGREYAGMTPTKFFSHCYSLRSRLVHGDSPLPTRDEISSAAASLEVMMSDLLADGLKDISLVGGPG